MDGSVETVARPSGRDDDQPKWSQGELPGTSVFLRDGERVFHTYSGYARAGDILLNTFNYLDLTPLGRQEEQGVMTWIRHHDKYTDEELAGR